MATGRKRFANGDVLRISLMPFLDKFVYCKFIDYGKCPELDILDKVLLVFENMNEINSSFSNNLNNIICNPIRCFGNLILLDGWSIVEKLEVAKEEYLLMDLKNSMPIDVESESEFLNSKWFWATNTSPADLSKRVVYDEVRHLESTWELHFTGLSTRIYFEICKINKWDYSHFMSNPSTSNLYLNSFDIPTYKNIPNEFRVKFCPGGISSLIT